MLLTGVLAAALTVPRRKLQNPNSTFMTRSIGTTIPVLPSKLNQTLKNPHQPLLNDTRGLPTSLAPKIYMGKQELKKPGSLEAPSPNFGLQYINVSKIPYYNTGHQLKMMHDAYNLTQYQTHVPWNHIRPDTRHTQIIYRSNKLLDTRTPPRKGSNPLPPANKKITKIPWLK